MSHWGKAGIEETCDLGHTGQFEWILLVALCLQLFVVFVKIVLTLLVFLMMLVNISIL